MSRIPQAMKVGGAHPSMKAEKRAIEVDGAASASIAGACRYQEPEPGEEENQVNSSGSFKRVLRNKSFLLLWLAQLISQIGFNAANYGIIVIVTQITGSTVMVGIAIISFTLPAIPFSILAGAYVDYLDKRLVLWVCNALRAITTGLMVVALLWDRKAMAPLYILSFFISLITQFFTPAESATIPLLVGKKDVMPALSLFSITLTLAQAIGFLALGQLVTTLVPPFTLSIGPGTILVQPVDLLFFIIVIAYIICVFLIIAIPEQALRYEQPRKQWVSHAFIQQIRHILRHDVRESWELIRQDRILFLALMRVSLVSILLLVIGELAGPFVKNVLHLPANDLSLVFAPAGIALVLGGLIMPRLTMRIGKERTISIGMVATAIGLIILALGQHITAQVSGQLTAIIYVAVMSFVVGLALDLVNIPAQTHMQERTPEDERGRIFSFQSMLYNAGSIPVILFAGVIADTLGIDTVMYIMAAALLLFQWWSRRYMRKAMAAA
jgi:Na+/melibiose symporter-like transporter